MANSGGTRLGVKRSLRRCRRVPFNLFPPIFQGILLLSSLDSRSVHLSTSFRWIYSFPCCFALRKVFESGQKSVESFVSSRRSNHRTYFYQLFINFRFIRLFSISFARHFSRLPSIKKFKSLANQTTRFVDRKIFQEIFVWKIYDTSHYYNTP